MAASQRPTKRMESRCTPATERATLAFEIIGYSLHKGMGTGKFIKSTPVSVGGYEFCIFYYPDGVKEEAKDYVSVFIKLLGKGPKLRALYDLRLVNQDSELSSSVISRLKSPVEFNPLDKTRSWGQANFKKRSVLEQSAYLRDDRLIIECDLTVLKEPLVTKAVEVQIPPSDLSDNFGKLLETAEIADVTFKVKGEIFRAHKIVLATRSPVLKAELYGPMRDKRRRNITVQDMQPAVFKVLLHFIYTDSLPSMDNLDGDDSKEMVKHLLVAADRYAMERMKIECEGILSKNLDVGTVATTLALADQHHCSRLRDACVEFIISSNRMDDVLASQGYVHLKKSFPAVLVDVLERATNSGKTASTLCPLLPSPIAAASDPHPRTPAMAASQRPTKRIESRCTPATEQATLAFEIIGYSLHKGMGAGKYIRSTPVSVGGYEWCIRYYPDGKTSVETKDYVSVFLELLTKGAKVRALYDLRLVNLASGLSSSVVSCLKVFDPPKICASGSDNFEKRSELVQSAYLRDDRLIIECDLTVVKDPLVAKAVEVQIPPSVLSDNFGKLLETAEKADVTFKVKGEVIHAHKIVLATRSPVFKAELYGPMRDKRRHNITVQDMQPAVFKALLHFIYTDSLPSMDNLDGDDDKEMVKHLLVAADRYAIERLKMICEGILCKSFDVETVATTLAVADRHHCSSLKDACVEFIMSSNRMGDVLASQGYVDLKRSCPDVLVDVLERAAKSRKI